MIGIMHTRRRVQLASDIDPDIPERASLVDRLEGGNNMFAEVSSWVRRWEKKLVDTWATTLVPAKN